MNTDSCDMVRIPIEDREKFYHAGEGKPGMFYWSQCSREVDGVEYTCRMIWMLLPGMHVAALPIRPVPDALQDVNGGHSWDWDGNDENPTLTPSVHSPGDWHGWIRNGRMESC